MTLITRTISWLFVSAVTLWHCIVPIPDTVLRDHCDCIDDNFLYDENGRLVFQQQIFLDFDSGSGTESIVDWRLVKNPEQTVQRDYGSGGFVLRWADGELLREVRSNSWRQSWYQHDYEVISRDVLPKEQRRGLRRAK